MISFERISNRFDNAFVAGYLRYVVLGDRGLTYGLLSKKNNVELLRRIDTGNTNLNRISWLDKTIKQDEFLANQSTGLVHIDLSNNHFTLIPSRLFEEGQEKNYISVVLPEIAEYEVSSMFVDQLDAYLVFAWHKELDLVLKERFGTVYVRHIWGSLYENYLPMLKNSGGYKLFINVENGLLLITLFEGKNLLLVNGFEYQTSRDSIYFVLLVFGQFKMNPEKVFTYVSGDLIESSELYHWLFKYIRFIELLRPNFSVDQEELFDTTIDWHKYYDLFCMINSYQKLIGRI